MLDGKEKRKSSGCKEEDDAAAEIGNGEIGLRVKEAHLLYTREPGNGPKQNKLRTCPLTRNY
jgi:hypothetical protein